MAEQKITIYLVGGETLTVTDPDGMLTSNIQKAMNSNLPVGWMTVSKPGENYHAINMANVLFIKVA